ncbi:MBG domain-containing protein, partial [Treponema sp. R6D11]
MPATEYEPPEMLGLVETVGSQGGFSNNFGMSASLTAGQVYYVAVRAYSSSVLGEYKLIINKTGWTATYTNSGTFASYNGSPQAATVVSNGTGALTIYYNGSTTVPTNSGAYTITVSQAAAGNYTAVNNLNLGTFTITKSVIAVTIKANDVSKVYEAADPSYTYTMTPSAPTGSPTLSIGSYSVNGTAGTTRPVGTYTITPQNFSLPDTANA